MELCGLLPSDNSENWYNQGDKFLVQYQYQNETSSHYH